MQAIWFPPVLPMHYPVALGGGPIALSLRFPLDVIPELDELSTDEDALVENIRGQPRPPLARKLKEILPRPPPLPSHALEVGSAIPPRPVRPPPQ